MTDTNKEALMPDEMWVRPTGFGNYCMTDNKAYRCDEDVKYIRADALDFKIVDAEPAPLPEDRQKALEAELETIERNWLDCGCMPCDRMCRERKEIVVGIMEEVRETIRAALEPKPSVDVDGFWKLEPLAQLIQDKLMNLGCTAIASECEDIAHKIRSQCYLNQGWQPIESVPKDGTPVDMWVIRKHEHGGQDERRRPNVTWGKICNTLTGDVYEGWQGLEDLYAEIIPTHWMPLPQPPSEDK